MKKLGLLSLFSLLAISMAFGQTEICNNGIDDDGDGFIDCYDGKCANDPTCAGGFLNNNVVCQAKPTAFPQFTMKLKWQSPNKTTNHLNRASVGDLDRDGIPEVVVTEVQNGYVYILNGSNGSVKNSLKVGYPLNRDPLIANIDNSSCAWIFLSDPNNNYIYAYDCNLNLKWKSTQLSADPILMGIADFDGDGKSEIYFRDEIIAAESGIRIVKGTNSSDAAGGPVAVDILDASGNVAGTGDNKLELLSGCNIFSVNLGTRTLNSGSLTLKKTVPSYVYWTSNGNTSLTSVVDYNQDGKLDIIATGMKKFKTKKSGQVDNARVFFWDIQNNVVKDYCDSIAGSFNVNSCPSSSGNYYAHGWHNGIGRVNIADIDGDGKLNASYIAGKFMYALDENFNQKWRINVNEETSGYTGCTVYDFNGDGAAEVVYRDEKFLYIINGNDGSINTQQQCIARTNFEYPIVSDLDGDGQTELCVTCGFDDTQALANFCDLNYSENSCVRVFSSASVPWVPSRKLWNQHAYFNVNVNDDLTIPKVMQKQLAIFSSGVCTIGSNRALNSFLNQSPFLDSKGCPTYASPNLINVQSLFSVQQPVCPSNNFTVTMGVQNIGDVSINGNVPVTFYKGDPTKAGATKLNTVTVPVNLTKNQTQTFTGLTVTGTGGPFTLYISLNDAGTSIPTPIVLPNSPFLECDYNNVISAAITPNSVHVTAQKINDNVKCIGATVPDNGAANAFVLVGGSPNTVDYTFAWYNGVVSGAPSYTGATYSGLAAGTYKVVATYTATGCGSDTASVTIARVDKAPLNVAIVVDKPNSSCAVPNGQVHAVVNGGDPIINYKFDWYEGNDIFTSPHIGTGSVATNLKGGKTYTVLVTDNASGCQAVASLAVPDATANPTATASVVNAFCVPVNSGSVSATVGGITAGYTFDWYNGAATKPSSDFTGSAYNSIPPGSYTVVATDNTSGCSSASVTVSVSLPPPFTVTPSMVAQQTSCDPAAPNGSVTATVGGVTAGYTFKWFKGQSTAPADAIAGPTGLAAGTYTALATDNTTGCTANDFTTVTQNLIYPVVTLTPTPNSICNPAMASSTYNGKVTASISYNGVPDGVAANYQFVWHQGSLATDPVIAGATSAAITQLNGGSYTLVVTRVGSSCAAPPATSIVNNTPALPVITTSTVPSTNCAGGTPNGSVNVSSVTPADTYTYQWFAGSSVGVAGTELNSPLTNSAAANLQGGAGQNYTVQVTLGTSGCQSTQTVLLQDKSVLPVLGPLSKTDNTFCVGANGTATIGTLTFPTATSVSAPYAGFTFAWSNSATTSSINAIPAGTYTLTATNTTTNCVASPVSVTVLDNKVLPAITTAKTNSTNCAGGTPNGSIDVTSVTPADTYTYQWFAGNSVGAPGTELNSPLTNSSASNLQGGAGTNYTVQVTLGSTGCQNTKSVTLQDKSVLPVLGPLSETDNTLCGIGSNGTATIGTLTFPTGTPVSAPYAGFTFAWSTGATTTGISAIAAGSYTLTATNTATNCVASPVSVTVLDNKTLPAITTALTPSTNCAGGTPNGSVNVTGVTPADTYTYQWFAGNVVGASGAELNSPLTNTMASNLQGGAGKNYTVQVTLGSSGCQNTKTVLLPDNSVLPILGPLSKTDNTLCVGSNGTATIGTLTFPTGTPVSAPYTGFTFAWSNGPTTTSINSIPAGSYTLTATHTATNCVASPVSVTVLDNKTLPTITTALTPSTNCAGGAPNGSVNVTAVAPADTYTYQWFAGSSVGAAGTELNSLLTNPTASNLQGGAGKNYIVQVTLASTGCADTKTVLLPDNSKLPVITASETDNTNCSASKNGTASLVTLTDANGGGAIASPFAGYSFSWNAGAFTTSSINNLPSGSYTLTVTNNTLNCTSSPATVTVNDNLFTPPISISSFIPQTSCDAANPNGILAATVDESSLTPPGSASENSPALYSLVWDQAGTPVATTTATNGEVNKLKGNLTYTITAVRLLTGCTNTKSVLLNENITLPTAALAVVTQQTKCVPPDGSITATVSPAPSTTYTYYWMKEQPFQTTTDPATVIANVSGSPASPNRQFTGGAGTFTDTDGSLINGNYTLVVVDNFNHCVTQPQTASILDNTASTITFSITGFPSLCSSTNGAFNMKAVRVDGQITTFNFDVHRGGPTNPVTPVNFFSNPPTFDPTLDVAPFPFTKGPVASNTNINSNPPGLPADIFSVVATDGFGCKTLQTFNLPFANAHGINDVVTNSTICPYTVGNGSINTSVILAPPPPVTISSQYQVTIYSGANHSGVPLLGPTNLAAPVTLSNLAPGFYTVEIQENYSGSNCKVYQVEEIKRDALAPVVDIVGSILPNTACDLTQANGSAKIDIEQDAADNTVGSTYQLDVSPAPLLGGPYPDPAVFPPGLAVGIQSINGLKPDSSVPAYTVTVTSSNNCVTQRTISIPNNPTVAQLVSGDVAITDAAYCINTLEQQAKVLISNVKLISGTNENIKDYQFDWYTDVTLTTNVFSSQGDPVAISGGDDFINKVPLPTSGTVSPGTVWVGSYWLKLTKTGDLSTTGGIGCVSAPYKIDINDASTKPALTLSPFTNTACDNSYEGKITVQAVDGSGPGAGKTYSYTWDPGNPVVIPNTVANNGNASGADGDGDAPGNLKEGTYKITAQNNVTGCVTTGQTTLLQSGTPIVVANASHTDQQLCSPDGSITIGAADILVNGVADPAHANFIFDWFSSSPATPAIVTGANVDALNIGNYAPIGAGDYYVTATRLSGVPVGSGCKSAPLKVTIKDVSTKPTLTLAPFTNTACDNSYEGKITVQAADSGGPGVGKTYSYTWDPANPVVIPNTAANNGNASGADGDGDAPGNLKEGTYKITITNNFTSCVTTGQTTLLQSGTPIVVANASHTDQQLCSPDGSITIGAADILVNGVADPVHANFIFDWFSSSPATPAIVTGANVDALNIGDYASIGAGDYYVTAARLTGVPVGSGCKSAPLKVTIKDVSIKPTLTLAPFTNTACDNSYEGKITVQAADSGGPGVGKTYSYTWDPANPVVIPNTAANNGNASGADGDGDAPGNLKEGTYKITITNNFTSCVTTGQTTLLQSGTPIVVANASHTDQQLCSPDGSITIGAADVQVDGVVDPVHANFIFDWFRTSPTTPAIVSGVSVDALNIGNYAPIGAGDYYVTASRLTGVPVGSGCKSAPLRVTINDVSVNPSLTLTAFTNTACDINFEGKITVQAADSGGPGVGKTYSYIWDPANPVVIPNTPINNGNASGADGDGDAPGNLKEGTYKITVTNNVTSCVTVGQTTLLQSNTPILAIIATTTDQVLCNPDGTITVGNVSVDNVVDGNHNDFTFNWYQNNTTSPPIVSGIGVDVLNSTNFATMGKGTYFVTVTRKSGLQPGSGCVSPPLRADINDIHVDPTIAAATINADRNCLGANGTGQITINEATPLNYAYSWFSGDDISGTPVLTVGGVNGEVAQALQEGDYTVQVRSNATNCVSVERYTISNNPTIVDFDPSGFSAPAVTTCTLATGAPSNGSATVSSILENNVSQPLTNYTFLWTDVSNNTLQNSAVPTLINLPPGSYAVKATNSISNCFADLSFTINDNTIGSTTVTLIDFGQPEQCVNPKTGFLTAQGGGTVAGPYAYEWYTGDQRPSPAGAPLATGATLNGIAIAAGQIFTVKTINSNNCWAVDAYSIPLIINPIVITASTNPLTYCTSDNGEVFSTIVNDNQFDYNFFWAKGATVNPPVDYTTNDVNSLPAGNYTVVAIDKLDPGCVSPTLTVTIDNDQIIPVVTAEVLKALTICDPARPDGVASADVAGDVVHFTFDWFTGNSTAGTSFYRGAEVGNLTSISYSVLATETTTGCTGQATVTVPTNFAVIPAPTVEIISNVTSCIADNGELSATVGGVTKDYVFDWANGTTAPPPINFTGEIYKNLSVGQYTVIATSRITGCVSGPATAPIINEQQFPKFDFLIQDASCQESNGSISLVVTDNVTLEKVEWYQNGTFVADGPILANALAGIYQVTLTTTMGCQATQDVNLPANILPFNGVSKTADNKNDFFLIQCIENFPRNHVEIFNRAGTKVYEASGYDNLDVLFDGKSNRGISLMGTNLPAGTYFYVISKGDGSRHMVGYLELVD